MARGKSIQSMISQNSQSKEKTKSMGHPKTSTEFSDLQVNVPKRNFVENLLK